MSSLPSSVSWKSYFYDKACSFANSLEGRAKKLGVSDRVILAAKRGIPLGLAIGVGAAFSTTLTAQVTGKVAAAVLACFLGAPLVKINVDSTRIVPGALVIASECLGSGTFAPLALSAIVGKTWGCFNKKMGIISNTQMAYFAAGTVAGAGLSMLRENILISVVAPFGGAAVAKITSIMMKCDTAFLKASYIGFAVYHGSLFAGQLGTVLAPTVTGMLTEYGIVLLTEKKK